MEIQSPIRAVDLPGIPDLELQGLIVVVGPNSSGKTHFLHDLNYAACGRPRELVVASAISYRPPPPLDEYLKLLVERGSIQPTDSDQYRRRSQYGADQGGGSSFRESQMQRELEQFSRVIQDKTSSPLPHFQFLNELGPLSCSALFLANRLTLMNHSPGINISSQVPSTTVQSLFKNRKVKDALSKEIAQVFQLAVWVDNTRAGNLYLRVADSVQVPSAEDRLEPEEMEQYRTIETEGDGLRSYAAICSTLLLEQHPLCLIDEPEMCLHPPQAHAMGRFIGAHTSDRTCTVVATHSSHVLRGILETSCRTRVIRLTRVGSEFQARTIASDHLEKATSKPRSRSEATLEGLFSHVTVLCEAEGDRMVYESVYRTFQDRSLDIRFIPSEGTGGFSDPLKLYGALHVPTAVIADLDFLTKDGELKTVLTELGVSKDKSDNLRTRAREAVGSVKCSVSHIDPAAIQAKLMALAQAPIDLAKDEDTKLQRSLHQVLTQLSWLRELQRRGLEAIPAEDSNTPEPSLRSTVKGILAELEEVGLFLVPVGELESWLPILMKDHSRENKSRWAILAAETVEAVGERDEALWHFVSAVCDFLDEQLKEYASVSVSETEVQPSL